MITCFQKIIELVGTGKAYGIVFDAMLQSCLEQLVIKVEKEWSRESCKVDEKLLGVRCRKEEYLLGGALLL